MPFLASTFRTPGNGATSQALFALVNGSFVAVRVRGLSVVMDRDTTTAQTTVAAQLLAWRTTDAVTGGTAVTPVAVDTEGGSLPSGVTVLAATASDGGTLTSLGPDEPGGGGAVAGQVLGNRMHTTATTGGQVLTDVHRPLAVDLAEFVLWPGERLIVGVAAATTASNPTTNQYVVNVAFDAVDGFGPPDDLTVVPLSTTSLEVSWLPVASATGYDVERDATVVSTDYTAALIGGRVVFVDSGRVAATEYSYRVRAVQTT
jgi:hypothetical protein